MYSSIAWRFLVKRNSGSYVIQIILPSITLVFISCISYWLHPMQHLNGRITLAVGCLIVLTILQVIGSVECQTSYTTAHDSWSLACFLFVSFSFVELLSIHLVKQRTEIEKQVCYFNKLYIFYLIFL